MRKGRPRRHYVMASPPLTHPIVSAESPGMRKRGCRCFASCADDSSDEATAMTTVGLPDTSINTAIELVSCLVVPSACAYGSRVRFHPLRIRHAVHIACSEPSGSVHGLGANQRIGACHYQRQRPVGRAQGGEGPPGRLVVQPPLRFRSPSNPACSATGVTITGTRTERASVWLTEPRCFSGGPRVDPFVEQFDPDTTGGAHGRTGHGDHGIRRCPHEVTIGAFLMNRCPCYSRADAASIGATCEMKATAMTTTQTANPLRELWAPQLLMGLVAVAVGVLVLMWPGVSILAASVLLGIYLVASGIAQVILAFGLEVSGGYRVLLFIT